MAVRAGGVGFALGSCSAANLAALKAAFAPYLAHVLANDFLPCRHRVVTVT
jgi:hypothetical protein